MTSIEVRRLGNKILAMGVATVLALSAIGIATPALTPAPVYATNYENNDKHYDNNDNKHYDNNDNKHYDNNDNKHYDNNDNHYSPFLMDVEQCFLDNGEEYSDEVEQCIYDVMAAYFDNDNNSEGSTSSSTTTANGNSNNDLNDNNSDLDLNQDPGDLDDNNSERMLPQM
jgi:hypothetical protein